jgi:hypothetical protein
MARMAAHPAANKQMLQVTRDAYRRNACLAIVATIVNPDNWKDKPCTSFEEYVASAAARTLRGTPLGLFTRDEVVNQVSRFYKVKADVDPITSDGQADAFAAMVSQFIAHAKTETLPIYNQNLPGDPDSAQRAANLGQAQTNIQKALTGAKLALSPHVYNRGFRAGEHIRIAMYKSDANGSRRRSGRTCRAATIARSAGSTTRTVRWRSRTARRSPNSVSRSTRHRASTRSTACRS